MKKILFYSAGLYPFVKEDFEILSQNYLVIKHDFRPSKNPFFLGVSFIKSLLFTLKNIRSCDILYSFFPGYHIFIGALFAKLFNKKLIIVLGGFESVWIPSINYGVIKRNNFYSRVVRQCIRWSDVLLAVDGSLLEGINKYADPTGKGYIIGVKNYVTNLKAITKVVPTGYDGNKWYCEFNENRRNSVVTVGNAHDQLTFMRKGFDFLIEIAKHMPSVDFYFIGLGMNYKKFNNGEASLNCHFLGFIENEKLPLELNKYKVFAQFSMSEGLPNSLCEAMLCGCIPVGSAVNGIPTAIGNTGFIIERRNVDEAIIALNKALSDDIKKGFDARNRILDLYQKSFRKERLCQIIDDL